MEDTVKNFAETLGIKPTVAKKGLSITSRYYILKSDPVKAGGLLSMLPPSLTNLFSIDEKKRNQDKSRNYFSRRSYWENI